MVRSILLILIALSQTSAVHALEEYTYFSYNGFTYYSVYDLDACYAYYESYNENTGDTQIITASEFRSQVASYGQPWTAEDECINWYGRWGAVEAGVCNGDIQQFICDNCGNCGDECPPVDYTQVGTSCSCEGGYGGYINQGIDENGCDYLYCDGCIACSQNENTAPGQPCTDEFGNSGTYVAGEPDSNGCPTTYCDASDPPPTDCYGDDDEDGTPNYLDPDNPDNVIPGGSCPCEGDEEGENTGTLELVNPRDDDPLSEDCPYLECACEGDGGDCPDEEEEPEEGEDRVEVPEHCKDCEDRIKDRFDELYESFQELLGAPGDHTFTEQSMLIGFDMSAGRAFEDLGVDFAFFVDVTNGDVVNTQGIASDSMAHQAVSKVFEFQAIIRAILAAGVWLVGALLIVKEVRNA